ncbi:hypothetical protein C1Y40_03527 [Mycobacterium talmoniae]|uniref:DUF2207 domain-containing protein n=1 Tax=Mycobacterium talmoniae TaxID=1858794 RepID=A0A2S8BHZ1_9MYCO|nr:hypothetical protein C1Y40_03527 [Mycobacterium talmoniae]
MTALFRPLPRLAISLVLIALSALGLLWPLLLQSHSAKGGPLTESPSTITNFDATYRVTADGKLTATETLTVEMTADQHGIFRFFPVADPTDPHARMDPHDVHVTMDGQFVREETESRDNGTISVVRIGDENKLVSPGPHTYTIQYTVDGGLVKASTAPGDFTARAGANPAPPTASFYYNVVGFWMMKITAAHVHIGLPGPAGLVQCTAGPHPCSIAGAGTNQVTVTAGALPAGNPVTARVDLQVPAPDRATLPWTIRFDRILGRWPKLAIALAVLSVLAALVGYLWDRRSRERTPGTPVLYAPPDGLGPVQTAYIVTEKVSKHAMVATLLYLAERKLVRLDSTSPTKWTITGTGTPEQWAAADPVTRAVGEALGVDTEGGTLNFASRTAGGDLLSAKRQLESACESWSRDSGFMVTALTENTGQAYVIFGSVGALLGFALPLWPTMLGLPFAAFAIAGFGLLAPGVGTRRTKSGRQVWSRAAGFQRLLTTPSSEDRFDYAAHKDLFISYVPYAVAFDAADKWAAKYQTATASEPPIPAWYPVAGAGSQAATLYTPNGFGNFDSAVSSSISAYKSWQSATSGYTSSSSSWGSGGPSWSSDGGSWGGGGGGGGGTW